MSDENIFIAKFYPNINNNVDPKKWYAVQISSNGCNIVDLDAYQELQKTNLSSTLLKLIGGGGKNEQS